LPAAPEGVCFLENGNCRIVVEERTRVTKIKELLTTLTRKHTVIFGKRE